MQFFARKNFSHFSEKPIFANQQSIALKPQNYFSLTASAKSHRNLLIKYGQ